MTVAGQLTANEDLVVDGRLEGTIELPQHELTVGPRATLNAHVLAGSVIVAGQVKGNITASGAVTLLVNASVDGDIATPDLTIVEGAHYQGRVDVPRGKASGQQGEDATAPPRRASPPVRAET